jgi:hypothetical protein
MEKYHLHFLISAKEGWLFKTTECNLKQEQAKHRPYFLPICMGTNYAYRLNN